MIAAIVYVLCALTALLCAVLLLQAWTRSRLPLLFWSGLCFVGLTASNMILVVDILLLGPEISLLFWRNISALAAVSLLVYGLVWEMD